MRLSSPISINDLRDIIQADFTVKGDPDNVIRGILRYRPKPST